MGDKGEGGVKIFKKMVTSFIDGPFSYFYIYNDAAFFHKHSPWDLENLPKSKKYKCLTITYVLIITEWMAYVIKMNIRYSIYLHTTWVTCLFLKKDTKVSSKGQSTNFKVWKDPCSYNHLYLYKLSRFSWEIFWFQNLKFVVWPLDLVSFFKNEHVNQF